MRYIAPFILLILILSGCPGATINLPPIGGDPGTSIGDNTGSETPPSPSEEADVMMETAGSVSFTMIFVEPGRFDMISNPFTDGFATLSSGYWLLSTETTYALWYEVHTWATTDTDSDGFRDADAGPLYVFVNPGQEGNLGTVGSAPVGSEPVTTINWRDAMLWCNALSEMIGYTPVYYSDTSMTTPVRSVSDSNPGDSSAGGEDNPYIDSSADGFRLPTEVEWDVAARGAGTAVTVDTFYSTFSGSDLLDDVAWYEMNATATRAVAQKAANELGFYDLSGNVSEWCFDWHTTTYPYEEFDPQGPATGSARVFRGGSYLSDTFQSQLDTRQGISPFMESGTIGFRPLRAN